VQEEVQVVVTPQGVVLANWPELPLYPTVGRLSGAWPDAATHRDTNYLHSRT